MTSTGIDYNSNFNLQRFSFKRIATMHYVVSDRETGAAYGELWRTRDGWRGKTSAGRPVEYFGISRDTAAGCLSREDV